MPLDHAGATAVLAALDARGAVDGVPRIEAAERRRLAAAAAGSGQSAEDGIWTPSRVGAGYLGIRRRGSGARPIGEAGRIADGPLEPLLTAAAAADATRVWLRGAEPADVEAAGAIGWRPVRTLLVLGRSLPAEPAPAPPAGLRLTTLREAGAGPVGSVLARAYAAAERAGRVEPDPEEGPWSADRVERLAAVALADPSDLLVALDPDGTPVGVHWTGRRGPRTGEVFNLAVDPDRSARGLGAWLLGAGLAHLSSLGHTEVVLWADDENTPARSLYARAGFVERGRDVALER